MRLITRVSVSVKKYNIKFSLGIIRAKETERKKKKKNIYKTEK